MLWNMSLKKLTMDGYDWAAGFEKSNGKLLNAFKSNSGVIKVILNQLNY